MDHADHEARGGVVEQGDRGALLAADVAEGVVAHDGAAREGLVELGLVSDQQVVEALNGVAQVAYLLLEVLGVGHEVAFAVAAEHGELGAPQTALADQ